MKNRALGFWLTLVSLGGGLALSGCVASASADNVGSSHGPRTPSDWISNPPPQSEAQRASLADGEVSENEYRDAFDAYRLCLLDGGYELVDLDESKAVITYGISDEAVQSGVEQLCYPQEFAAVDEVWQLAHSER